MTRDKQRLADYLAHIIEAIERIDRYTHGYFKVDLELVWKTIRRNLPALCQQVRELEI